jgi:hypothetical protein
MVPRIGVLVLIVSGLGFADPIIFTIQGDGAGTVGSTAFNDAAFTFTVTTDTSLVTNFTLGDGQTGFEAPFVSGAGISIGGIGSGTFTDTESIYDNNTLHSVGITDAVYADLLDGHNASFQTYDLQSSIGPLPLDADTIALQFLNIPTSLGSVTFTAATSVLFTATTVPEPGTLVLGAAGALLLAGIKLLARAAKPEGSSGLSGP